MISNEKKDVFLINIVENDVESELEIEYTKQNFRKIMNISYSLMEQGLILLEYINTLPNSPNYHQLRKDPKHLEDMIVEVNNTHVKLMNWSHDEVVKLATSKQTIQ